MKKLLLLTAAFCAASTALFAQSFDPAPGFSRSELFNLGGNFSISALGVSNAADVFYIAAGNFGANGNSTKLLRRSVSDNYAAETALFDLGAGNYGTFVRVSGPTVYFGEGNGSTIYSLPANAAASSTPFTIGVVANNYDLVVLGSQLYVSANPGFAGNKVFRLLLGNTGALSQLDTIIDTGGDNSGPIAITAAGRLVYGATGDSIFGDAPLPEAQEGGVFVFGDLSGAIDADPATEDRTLALSAEAQTYTRSTNQYLAGAATGGLFQTDSSPSFTGGKSNAFLLQNGAATLVGTTNAGAFFSGATTVGSSLFVAVTSDFTSGPSAVFQVVPEPSSMLLVAGASAWALGLRRRRSAPEA